MWPGLDFSLHAIRTVGLIYFNVHFLAPSFLVSLKLFDIISLQTSELDLLDIKLFHENEIA